MIYDLGIIIPVYRPRESIGILTDRIRELFSEKLTLRICIVDDSGRPETAAFHRQKYEAYLMLWTQQQALNLLMQQEM